MTTPTISIHRGKEASTALIADLKAKNAPSVQGGLGGPMSLAIASLGAFNSFVNTARKFKKSSPEYKPMEIVINNNTSCPIVIESFVASNVKAITDIPPIIFSHESKSIHTYDARSRDNVYTIIGRIGAFGGDNFRFKCVLKNSNIYNHNSHDIGALGIDDFAVYAGGSQDESSPYSKDTSVSRDAYFHDGYDYRYNNVYISCKWPDKSHGTANFGLTAPMVGYDADEYFLSFHSI